MRSAGAEADAEPKSKRRRAAVRAKDPHASFGSKDLVRTFALRAGVAVIALALAIGYAAMFLVESVMRTEAVRVSGLAADALLRHELIDVDITKPIAAGTKARIDEICSVDLAKNGIVAVKVWSADSRLLYSSNGADELGKRVENDEVLEASRGETVIEIASRSDREHAAEFAVAGPLVEVYAPLRDGAVLELYQSFGPIASAIERTRTYAWLAVLGLALPAYLIELQIVIRAARKLDRQESALAETNRRLARSLSDLEDHTVGTLAALAAAVDAKDSYTARHSLMVADYAEAIGRRLGLSAGQLEVLERACLIHDIGKIAVPEAILLKPGRLDAEEFEVIKCHAVRGAEIVESIPFLRPSADAVRHHHERYDGRGYPDGLEGEEISVLARVLAVADTFDAMTSDRPYRRGLSIEEAREELERCIGNQLCPTAVPALLEAIEAGEIVVGGRHVRSIAS